MGKRMICWLFSLLLAGSLVGCAPFSSAQKNTVTYMDVFDTVTTVTAYGINQDQFEADMDKIHALLTEYHRLYDIYHTYPDMVNLKTVNDAAGGRPLSVDCRVVELLDYGVQLYNRTEGRVNILFGAVLAQWHACREAGLANPETASLPRKTDLTAAAAHCDVASLKIDRAASSVCITDPQARLDVGAIAKGYVAEQVARYAADTLGWSSALINLGGNIRAIGGKGTAQTPFSIGIQNPDTASAQAYIETVSLCDAAVVTSGDYQRFYTVDGKTYAHIIDPDTLYPATHVRSVSVICADSGLADALSTALFTLPVDKGEQLIEAITGAEALWVLPQGDVYTTAGFKAYQ